MLCAGVLRRFTRTKETIGVYCMSFYTREEYLEMLRVSASNSSKDALAILLHDIRNRTTCAIVWTEIMLQDIDNLDKAEIKRGLSESHKCIRDINNMLSAVGDYLQTTNNQSPK